MAAKVHSPHMLVVARKYCRSFALLGKMKGKTTLTVTAERGAPLAFVPLVLSSLEAEKLMYSTPL